jgi:hypothetical protein
VDDNLTSFSSLSFVISCLITLSSFFLFFLGALVSLESLLAFSPLGAFSALLVGLFLDVRYFFVLKSQIFS